MPKRWKNPYCDKEQAPPVYLCSACERDMYAEEWDGLGDALCPRCLSYFGRKGEHTMTLYEMSFTYRESAMKIRLRIAELQAAERAEADHGKAQQYHRRILALRPILQQMRELAECTEHYYDKGYYRHESYRI